MASRQVDAKSYLKLSQIYNLSQGINITECTIKSILKKEGDINCRIPLNSHVSDSRVIGLTMLQIAAMRNETETVDILLKYGADFTVQDQQGCTALHYAVNHASPKKKLIQAILSKHLSSAVRRNPCDIDGFSHFHIACMYSHTDAMNFFLNSSVSVDISVNSDAKRFGGYRPLHFAAECSAVSAVRLLLENNANVSVRNARGLTPLHILLEKKIKFFDFYTGSDERASSETINAIEEAMDLLMAIDQVDVIGLTQLHVVCTQRKASIVESYLEENTVNINQAVRMDSPVYPGYTALHFAAHCNLDIVKILLKKDANLEAKDANGVTSMDLLWKIYTGRDIYRMLDANWKDLTFSDGDTRLLDFIRFAHEPELMKKYLGDVKDVETRMKAGAANWKDRTLLHFAVMLRHNVKTIKLCMGPKCLNSLVNVKDFSGCTPIHLAFRLNKRDTADILMSICRELQNISDDENLSYLHIACALENYNKVKQICQRGRVVDEPYRGKTTYGWITPGSTALHVAMASGNFEIIEHLLEHGCDVEAKNDNGQSPLDLFLRLDERKAVVVCRILLRIPTVTNSVVERIGLNRLHMAMYSQEHYLDIREYLREKDINAMIKCHDSSSFLKDYEGFTALQMAVVRHVNMTTVKKLIDNGSNLLVKNQQGNSALYLALSQRSDWDEFNLFIDALLYSRTLRSQFEEISGITMLHIACYTVNLTAVMWILTRPVDINSQVRSDCPIWADYTPLHALLENIKYFATNNDFFEILKLLIKEGADVSVMDSNNETPIHLSLRNFSTERTPSVVKLLIENLRLYNVNPVDRNGISHFHVACLVNNVEIVKLFLESGVDINQPISFFSKNFAGETPLHMAVSYETSIPSKRDTINVLLSNGADIKAEDNFGRTALHKAVKLNYCLYILEILVKHGAAPNSQDILGRTPLESLLQSDRVTLETIKFFEKNGCPLNSSNAVTDEGYMSEIISLNYHSNYSRIRVDKFHKEVIPITTNSFNSLVNSIDLFKLDYMGRNLLHNLVTTSNPHYEIVKYDDLIKRFQLAGIDIDFQDKKGKTALHLSAQFGNRLSIISLLYHGADINIRDAANMTPLNYAMRNCRINIQIVICLVLHIRKLQQIKLEVDRNNQWDRKELWNFVSKKERDSIILNVRLNTTINYRSEIDAMWSIGVTDNPKLILGDFLSEVGKGLVLYTRTPDLRSKVDEFFRDFKGGEMNDVCALQYRKAVKRVSLMESAVDSILQISDLNMPIEVIEIIFQHLSNSDLNNFIEGVAL